jgi:predicted nucleic acid-binding protein
MRVVDTSLWIELIAKGPLLEEARKAIAPVDSCIVPTIVHYELSKWCNRVLQQEEAKSVLSLLTECMTIDMDLAVAIEAAALSTKHKLHTTDAIIYATAQMHEAPLLTCDAHFKGLPGVEYFEK